MPRNRMISNGQTRHRHEAVEPFTALARMLQRPDNGAANIQCLGVTSSVSGEGVSTVAARLANELAPITEGRVLLVDANWASPAIHRVYRLQSSPGLVDVLRGEAQAEMVVHEDVHNGLLHVLTSGKSRKDDLLAADVELPDFVEHLRSQYDRIVFDLPPLEQLNAAMRWSVLMDGVLLVIEAQRLNRQEVLRAKLQLQRAGAKVVGAILNKQRQTAPSWLA